MNTTWNQVPLVRLVLPLMAGISTAISWEFSCEAEMLIAAIFLCIVCSIAEMTGFSKQFNFRWFYGIPANILCFLFGLLLVLCHQELNDQKHFSHFLSKSDLAYASIAAEPQERKGTMKVMLNLFISGDDSLARKTSGKLLAYIRKDSASQELSYGDVILLKTEKISPLRDPLNPGEFDQKKYLAHHSIYHSVFLKPGDWTMTPIKDRNPVIYFAISLRKKLLAIFSSNGLVGEQYAVLSALILGYTDEIDSGLNAAYASAGAMHILSVSGMHVGIIYVVLNWILGFLGGRKWANILRTLTLLLFLWFYALLTGLSPAVLRSAMMLSFVVIGNSLNKMTNIYNTLAASVFVLLVFNPYLLTDVGFQLSYLAVVGIVSIHPPIYELYSTRSKWKDSIWSLISVSIAAQLTTVPLSFYYFHQFPVYFLFSNLLVIPLSTIIIYGGIALLFISPVHLVSSWLGWTMNCLVWLLNATVKFVEHLPCALIQGIYFSPLETVLWYMVFATVFFFLLKQNKYFLAAALSGLLMLSVIYSFGSIHQKKQKCLVVYAMRGQSCMDFIAGNKHVFLADSSVLANESTKQFHFYTHWWSKGLDERAELDVNANEFESSKFVMTKNFISFYERKLFIADSTVKLARTLFSEKLSLDYVILSKNSRIKISDILLNFNVRKIIIDGSSSLKKQQAWEAECLKYKMPFYSVMKEGAFVDEF